MTEAIVGELSDLLWERALARDPLTALRLGRQVESLPPGGPEAMAHDVSFAVSTLGRLAGIDGVGAAFLRDHLQQEAAEAQRFWYRFPVTPYNALPLSTYREEIFEAAELAAAADADRYLSLLNDYAALIEQIGDTMQAQRERRIRLPAGAVPEAMATIRGHADAVGSLQVTTDRCAGLASGPAGRLFRLNKNRSRGGHFVHRALGRDPGLGLRRRRGPVTSAAIGFPARPKASSVRTAVL